MRTAAVAIACTLALATGVARGGVEDGVFTSTDWRVSVQTPRNWQVSEQNSYPSILLWMSRHSPEGKLLLSAERVDPGLDSAHYARQTRKVLVNMGFRVRAAQVHPATGAYWTDFDDGSSFLRQAYLVRDGVGLTLTLSAPSERLRNQHLRVFDRTLRSISFLPAPPPNAGDAAPSP